MSRQELLEIVHRHGRQNLGEINLVTLVQNRSQLRRDHRMISKRVARRKLGARCLRAPAQRSREQILHVPQSLLLVRIGGHGVFTDAHGCTYRGQAIDAKADGLGVLTPPRGGTTYSGGWSAGVSHGHAVYRYPSGDVGYYLHDRDTAVHCAIVSDGACYYDGYICAAADARLLALTAAALDADVRPWH